MSQDSRQALAAAIAHHQAGRLAEAEALYRGILATDPKHIDSLHLLGVIANQHGQFDTAIDLIGRAIALGRQKPVAAFHNNIGMALRSAGRVAEAITHFRRAIALKPDYAEAYNNLGGALELQSKPDDAAACYRKALSLKPDYAKANYGLGTALRTLGRLEESEIAYRRAIALKPDYIEAHNNLGTVLKELEKHNEAIARYRHVLVLNPNQASAHYNLGLALAEQGEVDEAVTCYERTLDFTPDDADVHWNMALLRLMRGEFAPGWREYEWRWRRADHVLRHADRPLWDGGDLAGRTILLQAEQGLGDTIQFVRYAKPLKNIGARVIVECQPGLAALISTAIGVDAAITVGDPLPAFDVHTPLMSLPRLMGTTLESVPAEIPYLRVQPHLVDDWHRTLPGLGRKIGLAWRGSPINTNDAKRSMSVDIMSSLLTAPGINWVSLQKDAHPNEIAALLRQAPIHDCGPKLTDWTETAALVEALDLVVTVDTAVAHLAGALGKPVWLMLPFVGEWRWLIGRQDTPWYPTARLFRQPAAGDWSGVMADIRGELAKAAPR